MKIKELKEIVDKAYENGKECDVEFWIKLDDGTDLFAELEDIGQFSIVPDMTLTLKPSDKERKIYTTKIVNEKQFDYKNAYQKLVRKIQELYQFEENILV